MAIVRIGPEFFVNTTTVGDQHERSTAMDVALFGDKYQSAESVPPRMPFFARTSDPELRKRVNTEFLCQNPIPL